MTTPSNNHITNLIKWLIFGFVLALPITNLELIPWIENKVQLPELVFVLLFVTIIIGRQWQLFKLRHHALTIGLGVYLGIGIFSFVINQEKEIIVELAKIGYLFTACLIISNFLIENSKKTYKKLIDLLILEGVLLGIGSICIWGYATWMNQSNFLVDFYIDYPIIGDTFRAKFLTFTPTMFALFLCVGIFFLLDRFLEKKNKRDVLFLLVYFTSLILTFSKTILLLIPILTILFFYSYRPSNAFLKISSLFFFLSCFILFNILSHVSIINKKEKVASQDSKYFSDETIVEIGDNLVVKNSYFLLKENALIALKESPLVGIGLGRFDNYLEIQKEKNLYPKQFISYDPHSTYFGVLAELGIGGGVALILIMGSIYQMIKREKEYILYIGILVLFLCEGIVTDLMNVRHLWLVIALLIYLRYRRLD